MTSRGSSAAPSASPCSAACFSRPTETISTYPACPARPRTRPGHPWRSRRGSDPGSRTVPSRRSSTECSTGCSAAPPQSCWLRSAGCYFTGGRGACAQCRSLLLDPFDGARQFDPGIDIQLAEDVPQVGLDRLLAEEERGRDLSVRLALHDETG